MVGNPSILTLRKIVEKIKFVAILLNYTIGRKKQNIIIVGLENKYNYKMRYTFIVLGTNIIFH